MIYKYVCLHVMYNGNVIPFTTMTSDLMKYSADLYYVYGRRSIPRSMWPLLLTDDYLWEKGQWVRLAKNETMKARAAAQKKSVLMQQADNAIAPLEDAVDLEIATEAEKAALLA